MNKNIHKTYTDDARKTEAVLNYKTEKRKQNSTVGAWIAIIVIIVLVGGFFAIRSTHEKSNGNIKAGSYSDYVGRNYKAVQAELEATGFTNIQLIDLNDSGIKFCKKNKVEFISIVDKSNFESVDYFSPNDKIVISYH